MIYGRLANEPPDYLFEAFDAWDWEDNNNDNNNENGDLLGKGSNYRKEVVHDKKSKAKIILRIIQVISITTTFALASNLVAIMFNNKTDASGSSGGLGGMQIKSTGTENSSLREKDMPWNEIKNHHNPYQFDDDDNDSVSDVDEVSQSNKYPLIKRSHNHQHKEVQESHMTKEKMANKKEQKVDEEEMHATTASKESSSSPTATAAPELLEIIKNALKDAVNDMEIAKEIKIEEDEEKFTNLLSNRKEKIHDDLSNAVHNILKKNSPKFNDISDEIVEEKIKSMTNGAMQILEDKELDKFENIVNIMMKEKEDEVEEFANKKQKGEHSEQMNMKKDIESMKNVAEKDIKVQVDKAEKDIEESFESDAKDVEKEIIREKLGVLVTNADFSEKKGDDGDDKKEPIWRNKEDAQHNNDIAYVYNDNKDGFEDEDSNSSSTSNIENEQDAQTDNFNDWIDNDEEEIERIWRKRDNHEDSNGKIDVNKEKYNQNDNNYKINEKENSYSKESNATYSNEKEAKTDQEHGENKVTKNNTKGAK